MTIPIPLFKYIPPARADIIENQRICFSRVSALNDPFELRPYFADVARDNEAIHRIQVDDRENVLHGIYEWLVAQHGVRALTSWRTFEDFRADAAKHSDLVDSLMEQNTVGALTDFRSDMAATRTHHADVIDSQVGVLSLSSVPLNLLMWAHYAQSHQGFVIEFDSTHSMFADARHMPVGFDHLGPVVYSQRRPRYDYLSDVNMTDLFFHKSIEWAYEEEWRMVRRLHSANKVLANGAHLFEVPPSAIKSIIFGCQMKATDKTRLQTALGALTDFAHVHIQQAITEEQTFALRLETVTSP